MSVQIRRHGAAVLVCVTTAACTALFASRNESLAPSRSAETAEPQRITQIAYGRDARFAVCIEPACPKVTPKTLALAPAEAAAAANHPVVTQGAAAPEPPPVSPEDGPTTLTASPESREERVTVHFVFGKATLSDEGKKALRRALPLARSSDRIVINGRTDSIGADQINQQLAFARALAVRDFIRMQVPDLPHVMAIHARGSCCFVADNDTAEGRQKNRRVEVVFNFKV